jgi:hydrogenase large subunit
VAGAPTLDSVTRSLALLRHWQAAWLEGQWLGCPADRWLANETWDDVVTWVNEKKSHFESDLGLYIRYALDIGLDRFGQGYGQYLAVGTGVEPGLGGDGGAGDAGGGDAGAGDRAASLVTRAGVYADGTYCAFDPDNVTEDVAHSFYQGDDAVHPVNGAYLPIDPDEVTRQGRYSFAKAPRYAVPGRGRRPLEVGPLARRLVAAQTPLAGHHDFDPLIADIFAKKGPSVFLRELARLHEAAVYCRQAVDWLGRIDLAEPFWLGAADVTEGDGYGAAEAAGGAVQHWLALRDGRVANYTVVTPDGWNASPRDGDAVVGPLEKALIGTPVADPEDPVELRLVTRSLGL